MAFAQKNASFLIYLGTNKAPSRRDTWPKYAIVKDSFWSAIGELTRGATAPFKSIEKEDKEVYWTLFKDNKEVKVCSSFDDPF